MVNLINIKQYFKDKLEKFGTTPKGLDWNSTEAQNIRFDQLIKVINAHKYYSILDYGSGFGSLFDFLISQGHKFHYIGYDIVNEMVKKGRETHANYANCLFTDHEKDLSPVDYVVESGVFNVKQDEDYDEWTNYVLNTLEKMNNLARKGMAFNLLTNYVDAEYIRPDLYYADPLFYFDYCKKKFSKNIALLHDYQLYDFTIIVRKE